MTDAELRSRGIRAVLDAIEKYEKGLSRPFNHDSSYGTDVILMIPLVWSDPVAPGDVS